MSLSTPLFLLALIPAAAVLALGLGRSREGEHRPRLALALRAAAALCLGLAAAGVLVRFGARPRALVVLDRSASLAGAREAAAESALSCGRALSARFDVGYASFAADARLEAEAGLRGLPADDSGTDVGAALRLAAGRLRDGEPAVVVTDGQIVGGRWSVVGDRQPPTANRQPSLVFLPVGPTGPDAALVELDAPAEVRPGEKFAVTARVVGSASGPVTVTLAGGEGRGARGERTASVPLPKEGRAVRSCVFEETAPESGLLQYAAELSAPGDAFAGNNSARALVRVAGKLRVGVLSTSLPAAAVALAFADAETTGFAPDNAPPDLSGFDVLLIDNLPRSALREDDAARLAQFVRAGGGLVVLGGPSSYGSGCWEDAGILEKELPVSMRPPDEALFVVLVLDRSGSMGRPAAPGAAESKLSLVKRAAQELLGSFRPGDRLAVVAFSDAAGVVAAPAEPANDAAAADIARAIGALDPGNSTHIADGLAEAAKLLPAPDSGRKFVRHVLLLSDGLPEGVVDRQAEVQRLEGLAKGLAATGATVSTVGTGGDDQDRELLRKIAEDWGRGRAYQPRQLSELASVFRRDLAGLGRLVSEDAFVPRRTADPLAGALGALPELAGRNRVSAKPGARTLLEAPPAGGLGREPLLAVWDRGRGRAACLATEFGARWGASLSPELLRALVEWAAGRSGERGCRLTTRGEGRGARGEAGTGRIRLELTARDEKGRPLEALAPVADLSDLSGKWSARAELLQESPSRYAAVVSIPPAIGEIVATARDAKSGRELARGAFPLSYPEELRRIGIDRAAVGELAALLGGRVIAAPGELVRMDFPRALGRGVAPAAPWLAAAGLLFVLCELVLRAARK